MKSRVSVIFGTRPEAIKLAPIIQELRRQRNVECRVCVTAQHRQMLDQVMDVFDIKPDVDLDLMRSNQSLADFTSRALSSCEAYLARERPDLVLVQGDTTTVFCAALAAFYQRIPVGHVEAGLRTWNLDAPWPEEANRVLTTRLATLHFAPTSWARRNLLEEGIDPRRVILTGNPVIDALRWVLRRLRRESVNVVGLPPDLQPRAGGRRGSKPRVVLITGHRRENFGAGFEHICQAIAALARRFPEVHFVYPVHLNPKVREPVLRLLGSGTSLAPATSADRLPSRGNRNIHLIEPLPYLEFVAMMHRADLILTDSGGVQEEAPGLGKPVLVMRETTERPEGVKAGTVRLVGTSRDRIVRHASRLLKDPAAYAAMANRRNPYGDGRAAPRIVKSCLQFLERQTPR